MSKHPGRGPSELSITSDGLDQRVLLNGEDISRALRGLRLRLDAGERPEVTLDVRALEVPTHLAEVDVRIPDETRALLVKLGWTPPVDGEQQGGETS